jgi:hypothetical protein
MPIYTPRARLAPLGMAASKCFSLFGNNHGTDCTHVCGHGGCGGVGRGGGGVITVEV